MVGYPGPSPGERPCADRLRDPDADEPVLRVDAIGTTSAGALVGPLAARCLQGGLDPVHVLHEAWVEQAQ